MRQLRRKKKVGLVIVFTLFFSPFVLQPTPGLAQEVTDRSGAGTEFMECRADAHYDMAMCYYETRESRWAYMGCNIAWELDLLGCDAMLLEKLCPFNWCEKKT